jgi:hypothetical protein
MRSLPDLKLLQQPYGDLFSAAKCLSEKFRRVGEGIAFAYPSINPFMGCSDRL